MARAVLTTVLREQGPRRSERPPRAQPAAPVSALGRASFIDNCVARRHRRGLARVVATGACRYTLGVGTVFVLRAARFDGSPLGERRVASLPIRIGRNALNDFPITDPGIAEFHALVEDAGGRLCVRDLNSPSGVAVRVPPQVFPTRIPARVPVDLRGGGFQFALGGVALVSLFVERSSSPPLPKTMPMQGAVLGNQSLFRGPGATLQLPRFPQAARGATPSSLPPTLGMDAITTVVIPRVPSPPPDVRARTASSFPPAAARDAPEARDSRAPVHTEHFPMALESLALDAVRELAASLVPERTLETTGDLARFVTKLNDLAEVFCRSFVPLREGHAEFISSLDLQRAAWQRGQQASPSCLAVETARTPEALALALLDFREQSSDGPSAVESIFADLMIHQVTLLSGVMQGVRALLSELSPDALESAVPEHGTFGVDLGGSRSKAIWAAYRVRYESLAEDDQALARIFGPEFTEAYREYRQRQQ